MGGGSKDGGLGAVFTTGTAGGGGRNLNDAFAPRGGGGVTSCAGAGGGGTSIAEGNDYHTNEIESTVTRQSFARYAPCAFWDGVLCFIYTSTKRLTRRGFGHLPFTTPSEWWSGA